MSKNQDSEPELEKTIIFLRNSLGGLTSDLSVTYIEKNEFVDGNTELIREITIRYELEKRYKIIGYVKTTDNEFLYAWAHKPMPALDREIADFLKENLPEDIADMIPEEWDI